MTAKPLIANLGTNKVEELGSGVSLYGGTPIGGIVIWSGAVGSPPDGFILCDGTAISRTDFATLFSIISTTFGSGNGSTTFNIPNLRDRFIVGAGSGYSLNATGGSANATLVSHSHTINNHNHTFSDSFSGTVSNTNLSHNHSYSSANHPTGSGPEQNQSGGPEDRTTFNVGKTTGSALGNHNHTFSGSVSGTTGNPSDTGTNTQGSSATDANLPPYIALAYIIRTV